jgi:hypothetical protein
MGGFFDIVKRHSISWYRFRTMVSVNAYFLAYDLYKVHILSLTRIKWLLLPDVHSPLSKS